jgi:hypothetical protein
MSYSYVFFSNYLLKKTIDEIIKEVKTSKICMCDCHHKCTCKREKKSRQKKRELVLIK